MNGIWQYLVLALYAVLYTPSLFNCPVRHLLYEALIRYDLFIKGYMFFKSL